MKLTLNKQMLVLESGAWININAITSVIGMFNRPHLTAQTHHFKMDYDKSLLEVRTIVISGGKVSFDYLPEGKVEHDLEEFRRALFELIKEPSASSSLPRPSGCCGGSWKPVRPPKG